MRKEPENVTEQLIAGFKGPDVLVNDGREPTKEECEQIGLTYIPDDEG
jgi:hypothetical protein